MVLSQKSEGCPLQIENEILPQVEEFSYLGFLFMNGDDGAEDQQADAVSVWCGKGTK